MKKGFHLNLGRVMQASQEACDVEGLLVEKLVNSTEIHGVSSVTEILVQHLRESPTQLIIAHYLKQYPSAKDQEDVSENLTKYTTAMVNFLQTMGKSYSFVIDHSTGQEPYNTKLHYEIGVQGDNIRPERITTFAHELTHEFDEKLAWEDMKKFLQGELINANISRKEAATLLNGMNKKNINLVRAVNQLEGAKARDALLLLKEQAMCSEPLTLLHESLKQQDSELAAKLRILQYNGTNSLYNKEKSNDFDYKDFVMYCVDRGKFGEKKLKKNEKYENVLNGIGKICSTLGDYQGDSHIRELVARTQEDIISDGKEYGILQELQKKVGDKEPSISDLLGVINVVAEGHITKMKERGCNELLVNGWSNFQKEVNMLQKQVQQQEEAPVYDQQQEEYKAQTPTVEQKQQPGFFTGMVLEKQQYKYHNIDKQQSDKKQVTHGRAHSWAGKVIKDEQQSKEPRSKSLD